MHLFLNLDTILQLPLAEVHRLIVLVLLGILFSGVKLSALNWMEVAFARASTTAVAVFLFKFFDLHTDFGFH